ncbi:MAG: AmmeMemoRadiSam system protein A [Halodesulfurarchaeum sp.]|nr:AmmeMemoRadiSam system protein A [Halodesulfurarchaeum sp.]
MRSEPDVKLDRSQGVWAVTHARSVVEAVVETGVKPKRPEPVDPVFQIDRGAFVTLKQADKLRGCIGRPTPEQPALKAIRAAAADAATADPRFQPVQPRELPRVRVEVSVLTPPRQLDAPNPELVTVGKDGLIVSGRGNGGLLLPQVPVEQDWDAKTFLAQTCRKAGLPADCWRESDVSIQRFSAQIFEEREPRGEVQMRPIESAEQ